MGIFKSTGTVEALFFILMFDTLNGQVDTESVANIGNPFLHQGRLSGLLANASSQHSTKQKESLSNSKKVSASGPVNRNSQHSYSEHNVDTIIIDANFDTQYTNATNRITQFLFIYNYTEHINQTTAVRVSVSSQYSNISDEYPVMFVARQQEGILSWRVPLEIGDGFSYTAVSRTLCPIDKKHRKQMDEDQLIYFGVSTMARENQSFNITARLLNDFEINHDQKKSFNVSASRPKYFMYNFPEGVETVLLKVSSPSHACMTVSVQKIKCPVFDLDTNVEFDGKYQTMSTQAAMFLQRSDYEEMGGFYVVFITKPSNKDCEGYVKMTELIPPSAYPDMLKYVTVEIKESITSTQYYEATFAAVGVFFIFYLIAFIIGVVFAGCGLHRGLDDLTDSERASNTCTRLKDARNFKIQQSTDEEVQLSQSSDQYELRCEFENSLSNMARSSDPLLNSDQLHAAVQPHSPMPYRSAIPPGTDQLLRAEQCGLLSQGATSEDAAFNRTNRASSSNYGATSARQESGVLPGLASSDSDEIFDEKSVDFLHDADSEKEVVRTKASLFVSDLAKKKRSKLTKMYKLYHINLITIAIFYGLPVAQLVITYQRMMTETGNEDLCYYNFMCAHPLKTYLSSFNNVFSNIGYVMLGILFILIVAARDKSHQKVVARHGDLEEKYGIPQYFGLYYAMGLALVMEGIMSGCYHVCPNYSNFQFDTSFMYIIGCLCILKIYQSRHPDINSRAHKVYLLMAFVIFLAVFGVVYGFAALWILYAIVHILLSIVLSAQLYYMGRWSIDRYIFNRFYLILISDCRRCSKPMYPSRFFLLLIGNAVNWAFALYGAIKQPSDFASYLLAIFIGNLLMYCLFYMFMKLLSGERPSWLLCIVILASTITWIGALYFFFQHLTSWQQTPAGSRAGNRECILMEFYDDHDVWHFLSAISLFFSFLILLLLDDDLAQKRRDQIPVF